MAEENDNTYVNGTGKTKRKTLLVVYVLLYIMNDEMMKNIEKEKKRRPNYWQFVTSSTKIHVFLPPEILNRQEMEEKEGRIAGVEVETLLTGTQVYPKVLQVHYDRVSD